MVSHIGERAHFSQRKAHRPMGAGICRPGVDTWDPTAKQENRANCGGRDGIRALPKAIGEAPMRGAAGADKHFDWLRGEVPNRDITALEVKR